MAVNLDACIQCNLCVRACREVQVNDVIGMAYRGHRRARSCSTSTTRWAHSTCVACGECVQACPTGALMPASLLDDEPARGANCADRKVDSVCPYCGVGCQLDLPHQGRQDPLRRRPRRAGQPEPALRQGPLRLRLRPPPGPADQAADPQGRRRRRTPTIAIDPRRPLDAFPRGDLGGGARRAPPRGLEAHPRRATAARRWPASARPRARTRRPICSRSWSAPASAPTTSITARGCATPPRWRR